MNKNLFIITIAIIGLGFPLKGITYKVIAFEKDRYVIYNNDVDTTTQIIRFDHLSPYSKIPRQITIRNKRPLLFFLLEHGFLYINNPLLATNDEINAENNAKARKLGYWKPIDTANNISTSKSPNGPIRKSDSISKMEKPNNPSPIRASIVPANKPLIGALAHSLVAKFPIVALNANQAKDEPTNLVLKKDDSQGSKNTKQHLKSLTTLTYKKTFNKAIYYQFPKIDSTICVPIHDLKVDYSLVQILRICDTNRNLRLLLIRIGAATPLDNDTTIYNYNERHAKSLAQTDKVGMWRNYDDRYKKPIILIPFPTESSEFQELMSPSYKKAIYQLLYIWKTSPWYIKILCRIGFILVVTVIISYIPVFFIKRSYKRRNSYSNSSYTRYRQEEDYIESKKLEIRIQLITAIGAGVLTTAMAFLF